MLSHTPFRPLAKRLGSRPVLVSGRNETPAVAAAYGYRDFVTSLQLGAAYPHAVPFSLSAQGAAAPGFSDCAAPQAPWAQQLQHLVRCGLEQLLGGAAVVLAPKRVPQPGVQESVTGGMCGWLDLLCPDKPVQRWHSSESVASTWSPVCAPGCACNNTSASRAHRLAWSPTPSSCSGLLPAVGGSLLSGSNLDSGEDRTLRSWSGKWISAQAADGV